MALKNLPAVQESQVQCLGQEDPGAGHGSRLLYYSCLENPILHSCTNSSKPVPAWASGVGSLCKLMSVQKTPQELFSPSDRQTSGGGQVWLIHASVAVFASSSFQPLERGMD